jgi:hypothetical protein
LESDSGNGSSDNDIRVDEGGWDTESDNDDDGGMDGNIHIGGAESDSSNSSTNSDVDADDSIPQDESLPSHVALARDPREFIIVYCIIGTNLVQLQNVNVRYTTWQDI